MIDITLQHIPQPILYNPLFWYYLLYPYPFYCRVWLYSNTTIYILLQLYHQYYHLL